MSKAYPPPPYPPTNLYQPQLQPQMPNQMPPQMAYLTQQQQLQPQYQPQQQVQQPQTNRFPTSFGFYRLGVKSASDLVIALEKNDPNPLFLISTHGVWSSKSSVILHSSNSKSSPPLATANLHNFGSDMEVVLIGAGGGSAETHVKKNGFGKGTLTFSAPVGAGMGGGIGIGGGGTEQFEWKSSHGEEVKGMDGKGHGMKLLRVGTGEVVAAWTPASSGRNKRGNMSFMGNRDVYGDAFEIIVVITIAGIIEKRRRQKYSNWESVAVAGELAG
ncbi:hypothetical protein VTL71DRAFT_5584 [Oculimacula yallundae]|uniref:AT-hook motif nuclear-localized protein n=1 Tax=Oculimacula yallundae TaxID=86028 RepID=A0ABR4C1L0_9HELO